MANYNHAAEVGGAIGALLGQSAPPEEIIVVDDGSTDSSVSIILAIARQSPSVRLVIHDHNQGAVAAYRTGLRCARGDFVYQAAADDYVLPGLFNRYRQVLADHSDAVLCCSDPAFEEEGQEMTATRFAIAQQTVYLNPDQLALAMRRNGFWIAGHTALVRRSVLNEAGGLRPEMRWHCDWFALLVVAFRYGVWYVPEPLACLRISRSSYSQAIGERPKAELAILDEAVGALSRECSGMQSLIRRSGALFMVADEVDLHTLILRMARARYREWLSPTIMLSRRLKGRVRRLAPHAVRRMYRWVRRAPIATNAVRRR